MKPHFAMARARHHSFAVALSVLAAIAMARPACADDYPNRPVRIIVPTGPGGSYDIVARLLGEQLGARTGQGFVVENKTGGGTIVGTQFAIAARPDGYTLLAGGLSNIVFNASLYKKAPYDAQKQLVPVAIVYRLAYMLVGRNDSPYSTVKDVIAAAKAKPDAINVATGGIGTGQQLTAVAFMKATGVKMLEIPYKGALAVYPDLLAGRVDLFFDSITAALPFVKEGKVKGLAILAPQRSSDAPDVPTLEEAGVRGLNVDSWIGLFAPAGTPASIIERLQKE
ncbi:MAG: tripartite tricarboxylate transporter substrate binding protein, partial [Bradyrhizobium sp.]|nr:tripartite tricarboxylate transporter substrate binding protein [Bradyrhizobium sp.]